MEKHAKSARNWVDWIDEILFRRSLTSKMFRTPNHHTPGTKARSRRMRRNAFSARASFSSAIAQQTAIDASRTNAISLSASLVFSRNDFLHREATDAFAKASDTFDGPVHAFRASTVVRYQLGDRATVSRDRHRLAALHLIKQPRKIFCDVASLDFLHGFAPDPSSNAMLPCLTARTIAPSAALRPAPRGPPPNAPARSCTPPRRSAIARPAVRCCAP